MALILDTGPLVAALHRGDKDHTRCRRLIEECGEIMYIPTVVLPEVDYLVSERAGPGPMLALLRDIEAEAFRSLELEARDYPRIRHLMDKYADSDLGFVDSAVIALAERCGESKVATLDRRHFSVVQTINGNALELLPT